MSSSDTQQEARTAAVPVYYVDVVVAIQRATEGGWINPRAFEAALADAGYRIVGPDQVVVDREHLGGMIKQVVDASLDSQEDVTRD